MPQKNWIGCSNFDIAGEHKKKCKKSNNSSCIIVIIVNFLHMNENKIRNTVLSHKKDIS